MTYLLDNDYYVRKTTFALLPAEHMTHQTIIHDIQGTYYSNRTMKELLEEACLRGGSKMSGRLEAAKYTLGIRNKIPLIIDPFNHIYAFPTHSHKNLLNAWIFLDHIKAIKPHPEYSKQANFDLHNGLTITAKCSYSTAQSQFARTSQLCYVHTIKAMRHPG
ncbi:competence protein ComK [Jeotgalibacillus proteolyticus]|uniref:Competence protein n=1 Tax=Jeotgalibacillus proteolyticus TaxID=2082395 RepID=A0A2S5GBM0_9BACL|nr:competence protein ComK [Jeotgalibacillus proteolyticus]PPA70437.1 hypothetical protein C4B60_12755 [Jeotgalibacillus proteolyticus]